MTAASNALEELQHARYLTDKGLRVALRRIDPTTKALWLRCITLAHRRPRKTPNTAWLIVDMRLR